MCGIAGIYNVHIPEKIRENDLRSMCNQMIHRGPDGEGYYTNGQIGFGHRRLSIIDLEGGRQPMSNSAGTIWITFNGEIYNFKALQGELSKKGYVFKTRSDTEAIIHAYDEWGIECVKHLDGMFAFAVWDENKKRLFAARDRFGEKPFFYYWDGGKFIFGSEIQALLVHKDIRKDVDLSALFDFFHLGYILSPKTIYQSIRILPQAHYLVLDQSGFQIQRYWQLSQNYNGGEAECNKNVILNQFEESFNSSIKGKLISDVPLGAFLSGGVDSTAVVHAMKRQAQGSVVTCSAHFRQAAFDESSFSDFVSKREETLHFSELVDCEFSNLDLLKQLGKCFGEPFGDSSMIPTYFVSKLARKHVTVALSGDGGDEIFGGYPRYLLDLIESRFMASIPNKLKPCLQYMVRKFNVAHRGPFLHLLFDPQEAYFWGISAIKPGQYSRFNPDYLEAIKRYHPKEIFRSLFNEVKKWDYFSAMQFVDLNTYLVDDILVKVDRMSMANSLEVRAPFLDHQMVDWLFSLPLSMKLRKREGKWLLKSWLNRQGYLPLFLKRRKRGFSIPEADLLRNAYRKLIEDILVQSEMSSIFSINQLKEDWHKFLGSGSGNSLFWWNILIYGIWNQNRK